MKKTDKPLTCVIRNIKESKEIDSECTLSNCVSCRRGIVDWLLYSNLIDIDKLKVGDYIMVKKDYESSWTKVQFLYYYNSRFYCAHRFTQIDNPTVEEWEIARLPETWE